MRPPEPFPRGMHPLIQQTGARLTGCLGARRRLDTSRRCRRRKPRSSLRLYLASMFLSPEPTRPFRLNVTNRRSRRVSDLQPSTRNRLPQTLYATPIRCRLQVPLLSRCLHRPCTMGRQTLVLIMKARNTWKQAMRRSRVNLKMGNRMRRRQLAPPGLFPRWCLLRRMSRCRHRSVASKPSCSRNRPRPSFRNPLLVSLQRLLHRPTAEPRKPYSLRRPQPRDQFLETAPRGNSTLHRQLDEETAK
jgi:hypothetical protein